MSRFISFNSGVRNRRKSHVRQREGYVLIMTLVLIVVAALSQAGLARRSLLLANRAVEKQRDLQLHWGAASCRRFMLDDAKERFGHLEEDHLKAESTWPSPATLETQVVLGGVSFRMWLADEDAKVNINTLKERMREKTLPIMNHLSGKHVPLRLTPDNRPVAKQQKKWYASWGQVFEIARVFELEGVLPVIEATHQCTCWGKGRLSIHRTSDPVLETVVTHALSSDAARELLEERKETPGDIDLTKLLKRLDLRARQRAKLRRWLTDKSTCFSLWMEIDDGQRQWYHLWIDGDRSAAAQSSVISFRW